MAHSTVQTTYSAIQYGTVQTIYSTDCGTVLQCTTVQCRLQCNTVQTVVQYSTVRYGTVLLFLWKGPAWQYEEWNYLKNKPKMK